MLNASTPSKPSTYLVNPMNASAMASPMPLSRKNRPYSRRMPVRARCRNVQCRFMKYELVAATTVDSALDVIGPIPRPTWKTFASPRSRTVLTTPMIPNLVNSWIRRCHCAYSRRRRLTRPIVRDGSVPPPGCHRTAVPRSLHQTEHAEQPVLLPRPAGVRSEEHTSELQSLAYLVCRLLLEKKNNRWRPSASPQCAAAAHCQR